MMGSLKLHWVCFVKVYLEVGRVDTQLESMQFAQGGQTSHKIVYFCNGIGDCTHDNLAVLSSQEQTQGSGQPSERSRSWSEGIRSAFWKEIITLIISVI